MIRTVLITGGSRGIGTACVRLFTSRGWNVAFTYFRSHHAAQELEQALNQVRPCCLGLRCDVADRMQVEAAYRQAAERFGRIDALVNNAGISSTQLFQDASGSEIERVFAVNVYGPMYAAQTILPDMIHRQAGTIVSVSSVWGITGASCEVIYSAAKAALIGFTKALAKEVGPSGIRVNCVAPGAMDTDMLGSLSEDSLRALAEEIPLGRLGAPMEAAETVYFLTADGSTYLTGQVLSPNGGLVI